MEDLIKEAKSGNEKAYAELIHLIQNDLYRIAKVRLSDENDICDAIQETIIIAYKKLHRLKDNSKFKSWIIKILINECNYKYRKDKKQENIFDRVKCNHIVTDDSIENADTKLNFDILISKLDYEERLIITLYYNSMFSCSEIAQILHMNVNTIKSKLNRAKSKLKKYYEGGMLYE